MRVLILFLSGLFLTCSIFTKTTGQSYAELGKPFIQRFTSKDYGTTNQIWYLHQTHNGLIYASTTSKILEYDGARWRSIHTQGKRAISVHSDRNNTLYAAMDYDFGNIIPDSTGKLSLRSFKTLLPENEVPAEVMRKCFVTEHGTYFVSLSEIFLFKHDKFLKKWKAKSRFKRILHLGNTLYLLEDNHLGLFELEHDSLVSVPGTEQFSDKGIIGLFGDQKHLLIVSEDGSLHRYSDKKIEHLFSLPAWASINYRCYVPVVRLLNGCFAFATREKGVLLFDRSGAFIQSIDKESGMPDNLVNSMLIGNDGALWVAMDKGIARVEINSPATQIGETDGLLGSVLCTARHNEKIYFGTMQGVFYIDHATMQAPQKSVKRLESITTESWDFLSDGTSLLVGNTLGIYEINHQKTRLVASNEYCRKLLRSAIDPSICWATTQLGILILKKKKGSWEVFRKIDFSQGYGQYLFEKPDGSLWISCYNDGIYRIRFRYDGAHKLQNDKKPEITHYTHASGLEEHGPNRLFQVRKNMLVAGLELFEFDEKSNRFINQSVLKIKEENRPLASIFRMTENKQGKIIINACREGDENYFHMLLEPVRKEYKADTLSWKRFSGMAFYNIYPDPDHENIWWLGGSHGVIRYDEAVKKNFTSSYHAFVRKVTASDRTVFYGSEHLTSVPTFPYTDNAIQFEASAVAFDDPGATTYQYYLEGFDESWSSWIQESSKNFTNLPEGKHIFHVRAKNIYGQVSEEDSFTFLILPPWYRSWWAYSLYVLFAGGIVMTIIKWQSFRHAHEKNQLEKIVEDRTQELALKSNLLLQQTAQLQEMDTIKSRFFANISHEFRTPLTLIMAPLEEKLNSPLTKEDKESFHLMHRNANRLLELVNQLLDLSKLEAGKMKLHLKKGEINHLLRVITASFNSWAQHRQITFHCSIQAEPSVCWYDADKLEKIISNVLSNSFKFTPAGGNISFESAISSAGLLSIKITDTGVGISEEEQKNIFSPFYQVQHSTESALHGTGLGLPLVKELVKLYSGDLTLTSKILEGTLVTLSLPVSAEKLGIKDQPAPGNEEALLSGSSNLKRSLNEEEFIEREEEEEEILTERESILVVEDHPDLRNYLFTALQHNFTVYIASNGKEGLDLALKIIPDLIITDLMMPFMDGMQLTDEVKSDERTSHIPIILLTAKNESEFRLKGWETGADDFLTKPFSVEELRSRAHNLIDQRKRLVEKFKEKITVLPSTKENQSLDEKFLHKVLSIVEENMANVTFGVEKLSYDVGMSRTQLLRKIKALTDFSPNEFIKDIRLKKAADLIRQKADTVTQIAYAVGFNDHSYFGKCFRKKFGLSPTEYAEKMRN